MSSNVRRRRRVSSMSDLLGVAHPPGWLCARIAAAALCSSADLATSRGYTAVCVKVPRKSRSKPSDMKFLMLQAEQLQAQVLPNGPRIAHIDAVVSGAGFEDRERAGDDGIVPGSRIARSHDANPLQGAALLLCRAAQLVEGVGPCLHHCGPLL